MDTYPSAHEDPTMISSVLASLKEHGSLDRVADKLASFEERQNAVAKPRWDALEAKYKV